MNECLFELRLAGFSILRCKPHLPLLINENVDIGFVFRHRFGLTLTQHDVVNAEDHDGTPEPFI